MFKKLMKGFGAVALAVSLMMGAAHAAPQAGDTLPADLSFTDSNGKTHTLGDFKGKYVVLEWSNHECPFVVKHYKSGNMQKLQKEKGDDVVWLKVLSSAPGKQGHLDAAAANAQVEAEGGAPTAVILDESGNLGKFFDAKTTPHMFVIDTEGKLAYHGAIDDRATADAADVEGATNYVTAALTALRAGQAVDPASTRAYGCAVKYAD